MVCASCGVQNIPGAKYCDHCGLTLPMSTAVPEAPGAGYVPPPTTSLKAVFSFIGGLLFFVPFASIAAIILGHMSRADIRRSAGRLKGSGLALTGLILGYASIVFAFVMIGVLIFALPKGARSALKSGWTLGKTSAAVASITIAQKNYSNRYHEGYACSLAQLGGKGGSKEHAGLIDTELAAGEKDGYLFELGNCDDHKAFTIVAYPKEQGDVAMPSFCSDETGKIRSSVKGTAKDCLESGT